MNLLGTCLHQGIGAPRNYTQAFSLFSRARDLGFDPRPFAAGIRAEAQAMGLAR